MCIPFVSHVFLIASVLPHFIWHMILSLCGGDFGHLGAMASARPTYLGFFHLVKSNQQLLREK